MYLIYKFIRFANRMSANQIFELQGLLIGRPICKSDEFADRIQHIILFTLKRRDKPLTVEHNCICEHFYDCRFKCSKCADDTRFDLALYHCHVDWAKAEKLS